MPLNNLLIKLPNNREDSHILYPREASFLWEIKLLLLRREQLIRLAITNSYDSNHSSYPAIY
ncbi:CLUMA_CG019924, isoform A [Clunio marinus]|uniref:CLUMA_CG019924, isoform A n=1 Tax=Clunio marinus TaxID=568069 RepID=A0A1J1J1Z9_9DIPT|nr:CLUMA_CG019924, isoform A [Clunio marinus]